ncbi:MAG: hypothetical protein HC890_06080 [Chloroflexaceae bacterium]|nr:hypothetical protein [Chloroflexaceae bacterium]
MTTTITIQLPDELANQLNDEASNQNLSIESVILQKLAQNTLETSPLESATQKDYLARSQKR